MPFIEKNTDPKIAGPKPETPPATQKPQESRLGIAFILLSFAILLSLASAAVSAVSLLSLLLDLIGLVLILLEWKSLSKPQKTFIMEAIILYAVALVIVTIATFSIAFGLISQYGAIAATTPAYLNAAIHQTAPYGTASQIIGSIAIMLFALGFAKAGKEKYALYLGAILNIVLGISLFAALSTGAVPYPLATTMNITTVLGTVPQTVVSTPPITYIFAIPGPFVFFLAYLMIGTRLRKTQQ